MSPIVGAAYVGAIVAGGLRASGVDDPESVAAADAFFARRYPEEAARAEVGVVATAIALGLVLGLVADRLVRLRRSARERRPSLARRARSSPAAALAGSLALVASLHASLVGWAMAGAPQLYAARWYAQGGLPRTVQVIATDVLGPRGVVLTCLALAVLYVGPAPLARLARRGAATAWRAVVAASLRLGARRSGAALAVVALAAAALAVGAPSSSEARAAPALAPPDTSSSSVGGSGEGPAAPGARSAVSASSSVGGNGGGSAAPGARSSPDTPASLAGERPPNVLVLAAGSLRADRLDPRVAPNLSKLAARATRFDRAYVSLPSTSPSWVTILSGRYAHRHGVRSDVPTREEPAGAFDALPARFAEAGYATGVVSDRAGGVFGRADLGFAYVDAPSFDARRRSRQQVLERAAPHLPVLHTRAGRLLFPDMREVGSATDPRLLAEDVAAALRAMRDRPFFVAAFFSAADAPPSPAPCSAALTDCSYRGRFKYEAPVSLAAAGAAAPDAADVRQVQGLYDGAVGAFDAATGRVLAALERLGLAERTIVVVTAGHGESLFEGGRGRGHGAHLFGDEGTHVPLVIYDPRVAGAGARDVASPRPDARGGAGEAGGRRERALVRDVDLAPTLYELAGIAPPRDLDGRSLAPALRGAPLAPRFAYAETDLWLDEDVPGLPAHLRLPYPGLVGLTELDARRGAALVLREEMREVTRTARHRMVRDARWKLVYAPTRAGVRYMLFDTEADPGEVDDVAAAHPDEVARLRAALWSWMLEDSTMEQRDGFLVPVRRLEGAR